MCKKVRNREDFIEKSIATHGNVYDYSLVDYKCAREKVKIICKIHGIFEQNTCKHAAKSGCPKCGVEKMAKGQTSNTEDFIKAAQKIHGHSYDYSAVNYTNCDEKVQIICKEHGMFMQKPTKHVNDKQKCPQCAIKQMGLTKTSDTETFLKAVQTVHGDLYDYSLVDYKTSSEKIKIICRKHGIFSQIAGKHLAKKGCPKCKNSKGEILIETFLKDRNMQYEAQKKFPNCKYKQLLRFDFFIPNLKQGLLIEYNGQQHYKPSEYFGGSEIFKKQLICDQIKRDFAKNNNYNLIEIPYTMSNDQITTTLDFYLKLKDQSLTSKDPTSNDSTTIPNNPTTNDISLIDNNFFNPRNQRYF